MDDDKDFKERQKAYAAMKLPTQGTIDFSISWEGPLPRPVVPLKLPTRRRSHIDDWGWSVSARERARSAFNGRVGLEHADPEPVAALPRKQSGSDGGRREGAIGTLVGHLHRAQGLKAADWFTVGGRGASGGRRRGSGCFV